MNEAQNIPHVFERIPEGIHELILVDGHSSDDTISVARAHWAGLRVVEQTRRGKGNALACGFSVATGEVLVMMDADGSTDPCEIPAFVAALLDGADVAKGSRFAVDGGSDDITRSRRFGNAALNKLSNALHGTDCSDLCYGFMAFWAGVLPALELPEISLPAPRDGSLLWGDGFEVETLIAIRAARSGMRVVEVPSFERNRVHGTSNLNATSDGLRVLRTIFAEVGRRSDAREMVRGASTG